MQGETSGAEAPTFGDYVRVLRRRAWVVASAVAATVTISMLIVASTTPRYESTAEVLLSRDSPAAVLTGTTGQNDRGDPERFIQTQLQIAETPALAQRVLDRAGLHSRTTSDLLAATQVVAPPTTDVLTFRVQDDNRALSARLANTFAEQFTTFQRELDQSALGKALVEVSAKLQTLQRNGQTGTSVYRDLVAKQKQIETLQPLQSGKAVVLARAIRTVQVKPAPKRDLIVAVLAGFLLGAVLAFALDALDRRAYSARTLVDELGMPLLAQLPRHGRFGRPEHLTVVAAPDGPHMEAYQLLRANLEAALERAGLELPDTSVMLTAARHRDGKSTVAANLGVALAAARRRVVLVEADNRSSLSLIFGRGPGPGLLDVARGETALEDALLPLPSDEGELRLLPLGDPSGTFAAALASGSLNAVLAQLRSEADIVIIDAPPLLENRGAVQLASHVDALALVVSVKGIPMRTLHAVRATIPSRRAVELGIIATGAGTHVGLDRSPVAQIDLPRGTRDAPRPVPDRLQASPRPPRVSHHGSRP